MATFKVPVLRVDGIEPIENADAIEVARILGYQCVVRKGELNAGDPVVYIPEASIVPEWLLRKLNLWDDEKGKGRLAGSNGDRVKAIRLRGVISQGLVYPTNPTGDDNVSFLGADGSFAEAIVGDDVAAALGIEKWEPEIPSGMAGEFFYFGVGKVCPKYDVENFKNFPNVLKNGEEVEFTEKIHGTCTVFTRVVEEDNRAFFGHWLVTSKGQGGDKGLALYDNEKNRTSNVYVHVFLTDGMAEKFERAAETLGITGQYTVFGETFGSGVQDLAYGATNGKKLFRGFDVYVGEAPMGRYLNLDEKKEFFDTAGVPMVPVLYRGPFSLDAMKLYTDGKEAVSGKEACIREGIVIRVAQERYEAEIGRVMLKSVSAAYLTRKDGTEFT